MIKKSDIVRDLVGQDRLIDALKIAKSFNLWKDKEDKDKVKTAYDCYMRKNTYISMGYDIALEALQEK